LESSLGVGGFSTIKGVLILISRIYSMRGLWLLGEKASLPILGEVSFTI
jgi:hypothetical protein